MELSVLGVYFPWTRFEGGASCGLEKVEEWQIPAQSVKGKSASEDNNDGNVPQFAQLGQISKGRIQLNDTQNQSGSDVMVAKSSSPPWISR
jgi:hypothetical protein